MIKDGDKIFIWIEEEWLPFVTWDLDIFSIFSAMVHLIWAFEIDFHLNLVDNIGRNVMWNQTKHEIELKKWIRALKSSFWCREKLNWFGELFGWMIYKKGLIEKEFLENIWWKCRKRSLFYGFFEEFHEFWGIKI